MTHLGYIAAAYGATAIILGGIAAWAILDLRIQKARLARLDPAARRPR